MKNLRILFALILVAILASCDHSTTTENNGGGGGSSVAWTIPDSGSTYIFSFPPEPPDSQYVFQKGQHIGGKLDVFVISNKNPANGITYFNIEPNGDISNGYPVTDSVWSWKTYPTGSQKTINVTPPVDSFAANGDHFVFTDVCSFVGAETTNVAAGQFATLHINEYSVRAEFSKDSDICVFADTSSDDSWYAPSIGFIIKYVNRGNANGQPSTSDSGELVKYIGK